MNMAYRNTFNLVAGKGEPKEQAELVTQILYGEYVEKIGVDGNWVKVKIIHDEYECFIDKKIFLSFKQEEFQNNKTLVSSPTSIIKNNDREKSVLAGSYLSAEKEDFDQNDARTYAFEEIKKYIDLWIDAPYLWGGRSIFGIDCSGFSQLVYRIVGIHIKRDAKQQVKEGKEIKLKDAQTGDLAFFTQKTDRVSHVGIIILENTKFLIAHASGQVRIDTLDENGILNRDSGEYSHTYHSVRTYL